MIISVNVYVSPGEQGSLNVYSILMKRYAPVTCFIGPDLVLDATDMPQQTRRTLQFSTRAQIKVK